MQQRLDVHPTPVFQGLVREMRKSGLDASLVSGSWHVCEYKVSLSYEATLRMSESRPWVLGRDVLSTSWPAIMSRSRQDSHKDGFPRPTTVYFKYGGKLVLNSERSFTPAFADNPAESTSPHPTAAHYSTGYSSSK